jgi:hypothetical protein
VERTESIPASNTTGAEASSSDRLRPYGIDVSAAGTMQESYFMVLAGLLAKNLAVQIEIRDELKTLNQTSITRHITVAGTRSEDVVKLVSDSLRQGKKIQR